MTKGPANPERSFGLSVGTVLLLIGAYLSWRGRLPLAATLGGVGGLLVVLGLLRPALLAWPSRVWWRFSLALGYVNARVLLTVVYVLGMATIGLIWRLIGRDPLERRRAAFSGWSPYPARYRDRHHYTRMY